MGRMIDVSELYNVVMLNKSDWGIFATPIDQFVESLVSQVSTVEAIPKADYENRLKADMVAMLEEFDLELYEQYEDTDLVKVKYIRQAIQEKINSLKVEHDPTPQI